MSDWLQQLSELEQREAQATEEKWYVVGPPWGDGGFVVAGDPDPHVGRYVCNTDDLLIMDDEEAKEHGASNKLADAEFIAAFRNSASDLIERARRADELEREITWLKQSLGSVERKLSLVRHRRNIRWGEDGLPEAYDVDVVIGQARRLAYEEDA